MFAIVSLVSDGRRFTDMTFLRACLQLGLVGSFGTWGFFYILVLYGWFERMFCRLMELFVRLWLHIKNKRSFHLSNGPGLFRLASYLLLCPGVAVMREI